MEKDDFYYDGIENGKQGWMTRIKNQNVGGCNGLCFVYGTLGAIEATANLYFNDTVHKDYDLSIQHFLDCGNYSGNICEYGGNDLWVSLFAKTYEEGIYQEEECYVRADSGGYPAINCQEGNHQDTDYKISITDTGYVYYVKDNANYPIENIKEKLIQKGPMASTVKKWASGRHTMVLTGYGEINADDIFHDRDGVGHVVGEDSPYLGYTYWIYKNSWGDVFGDHGYFYMLIGSNDPWKNSYSKLPIIDLKLGSNQESPSYYDLDQDGYWNWGISDIIPSGCPEIDPTMRDSDDSEPGLGPFDEDYYSIPVSPIMEVSDAGQNKIPPNTFYSFYDSNLGLNGTMILEFTIENKGNAQLNLFGSPFNGENVHFSGENATDFTVYNNNYPNYEIPYGTSQTFYVEFTLTAPITETKVATLTIDVEEEDREDYIFNLIFTDCSQALAQTQYISSDETWSETNEPYLIFGNLQVEDGATLTIDEGVTVAFMAGTSLFIETGGRLEQNGNIKPGGKVYVNDGLLTSFCGVWNGVDVWGYGDESQLPDQEGDYSQGYIKLYNGGVISNALVGIETRNDIVRQNPALTSGGIVILNEGQMVNCIEGIVFYPYKNFHPYAPTNEHLTNLSSITLSKFYNDHFSPLFQHIKMEGVDGINIKGCTFINVTPASPVTEPIGINSLESSFSVECYVPLPWEGDPVQTTFENFDKAISASNNSPYGNIKIDSVYFEDNKRGIYLSQVNNPVIIKNEFNVRKKFSFFPESVEMIGLYVNDDSEGYIIEENEFYSELRNTELQTTTCEGITLNNSGQKPNEVYNNSFNSLSAGIVAAGENRDDEGAGLCIKCNDFRDCLLDIWVIPGEDAYGNPYNGPTIGIAEFQGESSGSTGNPTMAGGNTFSKANESLGVVNYENEVSWNDVEYTHHNNVEPPRKIRPLPYTIGDVNPIEDQSVFYSKDLSCPSNYNGGGIDKAATKSTYSTELLSVSAYEDTLSTLVDGGDTEDLTWDVNMSTPPEAANIRQELLDESPYLSDTVMKSAITKEEVLPNAMLRDVLVANPQSAKSNGVLQAISDRSDTMPGYMMDQIMQGINTYGAKELLEQQLAGHKTKKGKAMTQLMHYYLVDTANYAAAIDSMLNLLENDDELSSQYQLTMKYLGMKDSASTYNTFYNIPNYFDLNNAQEDEYDLYEDLIDLQWQMMNDTVMPDSTVIDALFDIEQYDRTTPGVFTRNLLISLGELVYDEPVYIPDFNKSAKTELPLWSIEIVQENIMKLFPNPAGEYFIVEYDLRNYVGDFSIQVFNVSGLFIETMVLRNKQNQFVVTTQNYLPGIYIVQLCVDGSMIETDKIVIVK